MKKVALVRIEHYFSYGDDLGNIIDSWQEVTDEEYRVMKLIQKDMIDKHNIFLVEPVSVSDSDVVKSIKEYIEKAKAHERKQAAAAKKRKLAKAKKAETEKAKKIVLLKKLQEELATDKINIAEVVDFCEQLGPDSDVYIGVDSEKYRKGDEWWADYCTVVVVHRHNNNGGKIFGAIHKERVYDKNPARPSYRLMKEVYLAAEIYLELSQVLYNRIECHIDINDDIKHGSSCVLHEAVGYIRGVCNTEPKLKPHGWAASSAADQLKRVMNYKPSTCQ
jgi:predicted RNase H-related nuclease YkuK (DUF458 family)